MPILLLQQYVQYTEAAMTGAGCRPVCDRFKANVAAEVPSEEVHVLSPLFIHATKNINAIVVGCHAGTGSYHLYKQSTLPSLW